MQALTSTYIVEDSDAYGQPIIVKKLKTGWYWSFKNTRRADWNGAFRTKSAAVKDAQNYIDDAGY